MKPAKRTYTEFVGPRILKLVLHCVLMMTAGLSIAFAADRTQPGDPLWNRIDAMSWTWRLQALDAHGRWQERDLRDIFPLEVETAAGGKSHVRQIASFRELDPSTGARVSWRGIPWVPFIEGALSQLTPEDRTQIDLLAVSSTERPRETILIPRWLVVKYSPWIALERDGKPIAPTIVFPWSTRATLSREEVPALSFLVKSVGKVTLTGTRAQYASMVLLRRTDPVALRGEKLFLKNCMACHSAGFARQRGPAPAVRELAASQSGIPGHRSLRGLAHLDTPARRALVKYIDALVEEGGGGDASKRWVTGAQGADSSDPREYGYSRGSIKLSR